MEHPKFIYKYQSICSNTLKNLNREALYMASPLSFNDPYDCALTTMIKEITDGDVERWITHYLQREDTPEALKKEFRVADTDQLKQLKSTVGKSVIGAVTEMISEVRGVTCFTDTKDDLLMWAHYADSYRGLCLEFRTDMHPFNGLGRVKYTANLTTINLVDHLVEKTYNLLGDLYFTKSVYWAHEKEWRLLHPKADALCVYPPKALKAVYFGPRVEPEMRDIVCLILQGQNPDVEFWSSQLSKSEFKLEFQRFNFSTRAAMADFSTGIEQRAQMRGT